MAQFPIRVKRRHFAGMGKVVYDSRSGDLASILQGILGYLASSLVQSSKVGAFTDNSTGTAVTPPAFVNAVIPTAPFDASGSAVGAPLTGFNTQLGTFANAGAVIADQLNRARARIGLPNITWASGTIATAGTIPAQTLSFSAAQGTSAVDYATGVAALLQAVENMKTLQDAFNEVLYACGLSDGSPNKVVSDALIVPSASWSENTATTPALGAFTNASASATGASSIANTVAGAFWTAIAANISTIAAAWDQFMAQGTVLTNLTDSTTGTPTSYGSYALTEPNAVPATFTDTASSDTPITGLTTQLGLYTNALTSLADRMNKLREKAGLPEYTNSIGGTISTTLAAMSASLSATSGTSAPTYASAAASLGQINNLLSSLAVGVNQVLANYGVAQIADTGPLGTVSTTLGAIPALVAEAANGQTMANTAVNTWLGNSMNSISTLAAALNQVTGTGEDLENPLQVVAVAG